MSTVVGVTVIKFMCVLIVFLPISVGPVYLQAYTLENNPTHCQNHPLLSPDKDNKYRRVNLILCFSVYKEEEEEKKSFFSYKR